MASVISPSPTHLGIARIAQAPPDSGDVLNVLRQLLQKNHDEFHMFWQDLGGHNHTVHSLLTVVAMGGNAADVQRAYADGAGILKPRIPADPQIIPQLADPEVFRQYMGELDHYTDFLVFFEQQIENKGWQSVVDKYCFSRTELADIMLGRLFEGLFHPIINLGFGIEFELPAVIAEGLAQAACHNTDDIDLYFLDCERTASALSSPSKPLVELLEEVYANEKIRRAVLPSDGPLCVKDGVLGRARPEVIVTTAQYQVQPNMESIQRATIEDVSCAAYTAGTAQQPNKKPLIDFFYLHNVTSSIFLTVIGRQECFRIADRARLVEWKARFDLVWYAASGTAPLYRDAMLSYVPGPSAGMGWPELYRAVLDEHDDGHLAKFVRALKHGQDLEEAGQCGPDIASLLPINGDLWLRVAQMGYDLMVGKPDVMQKWMFGAGFAERWGHRP